MTENYVGTGKVVLIAGGGKVYTDVAARFVSSERELEEIIASPYSKEIVSNILNSGHKAALEFDQFVFGVDGYSRVCEAQLVRKRMASYLIKSGRVELKGKRQFRVTYPESVAGFAPKVQFPNGALHCLSGRNLAGLIEQWYNAGIKEDMPEEDLRYLKPQATTFRGIIAMNAHGLWDWFAIRLCKNAQKEIRDMAQKMFALCKDAAPDLFEGCGPNCVQLGYCPENSRQHPSCKGRVFTKEHAMQILKAASPQHNG